jgi:hypothetical protein
LNLGYSPVSNSVGELAVVSLSFPTTGFITRLTS